MKYGTKHSPIFLPTFVSNIATFKKSAYDPNIAFFPFQRLLQNSGKNRFFNIPFKSSSMAGEVRNETLANFFCQHVSATSQLLRKALTTTQALHFFLSSSCCKTEGKTGFFNILFKSSSMAGEVWNQTLAIFLPTFVSNIATFKKSAYDPSIAFFPFQQSLQNRRKNRFFQHPFHK